MTFRSILFAAGSALALSTAAAWAKDSVTIGLQLEPPHLDPTSAAAGAIDQVLYSNVFEGLTRFMVSRTGVARIPPETSSLLINSSSAEISLSSIQGLAAS